MPHLVRTIFVFLSSVVRQEVGAIPCLVRGSCSKHRKHLTSHAGLCRRLPLALVGCCLSGIGSRAATAATYCLH